MIFQVSILVSIIDLVTCIKLPESCGKGEYYDPDIFSCVQCFTNASLVPSEDGFGCVCDTQSVPYGINQCRQCNATEIPTFDKTACVPRSCKRDKTGRLACRRCPADYILVTQNFDGSPMREVQCVKCTKGYHAVDGLCKQCTHCSCQRYETVVGEACLPRGFVNARPKHDGRHFHTNTMVGVIKNEYFCLTGDIRACRFVANACVQSFYSSEDGGPCRLWIQGKQPPGITQLMLDPLSQDSTLEDLYLPAAQKSLLLITTVHTASGGIKFFHENNYKHKCFLPVNLQIGRDLNSECSINVTELSKENGNTLTAYLDFGGKLYTIPISIKPPNGRYVQKGAWKTDHFRRYFIIHTALDPSSNVSTTTYLSNLLIKIRIKRDKSGSGLRVAISAKAEYSTVLGSGSGEGATSLHVTNELPLTGVLRALEIWGGVLGASAALYAAVLWRGVIRRGGSQLSLAPLLAGSLADALHVAALCATLLSLATEITTTGLPLPLTKTEENTLEAFIYAAAVFKIVRVLWFNWCQSTIDIFLIDWTDYTSNKEAAAKESRVHWGSAWLAREWAALQTTRRASPGYTVPMTLLFLKASSQWQSSLPRSPAYLWSLGVSLYLCAHWVILCARWILSKVFGCPAATLMTACRATGVSLLLFQEELYAHYIHGRNDMPADARSLAGPPSTCRVVCAPQLRLIYKQLSLPEPGNFDNHGARRALLSKFLAAFFERALDGLSWVASERTLLERLFDVELTSRESGNTSTLLYDPDDSSPSFLGLTWWGEEWDLATCDALIFGCVLLATGDYILSGIICLAVWQILKWFRKWIGHRNIKNKTDIEVDIVY